MGTRPGFSMQETLGIGGGQPTTLLADADRDDFVLALIDGVKDRCSGEQRYLVLSTAAAK